MSKYTRDDIYKDIREMRSKYEGCDREFAEAVMAAIVCPPKPIYENIEYIADPLEWCQNIEYLNEFKYVVTFGGNITVYKPECKLGIGFQRKTDAVNFFNRVSKVKFQEPVDIYELLKDIRTEDDAVGCVVEIESDECEKEYYADNFAHTVELIQNRR